MSDLAKTIRKRAPGRSKKQLDTLGELVAVATSGLDEAVGRDGTKAVESMRRFLLQILAGLRKIRTVAARIFSVGTGPPVKRIIPGESTKPWILRKLEGDQKPFPGMTFETRLTGGVREARGILNADASITIDMGGYVFPFPGGASKFRTADKANDFSLLLPDASKKAVGKHRLQRRNPKTKKLETYERAHLWGHGFGDEARDGIMYAPAEFNQFWQNKGVERWIRELSVEARKLNGNLVIRARATSYSPREITQQLIKDGQEVGKRVRAGDGEYLLKEVTYELFIETPDKPGFLQPFHKLEFEIPPPWEPHTPLKLPFNPDEIDAIPLPTL